MVSCTLDSELSRRQFTMLSDLTINPAAFLMLMVVTPLYIRVFQNAFMSKNLRDHLAKYVVIQN